MGFGGHMPALPLDMICHVCPHMTLQTTSVQRGHHSELCFLKSLELGAKSCTRGRCVQGEILDDAVELEHAFRSLTAHRVVCCVHRRC